MRFIIGSFLGAVIGYITNWLAIKMLFWPHRKITIGRFIIPFTPGLIPKERARIAKSIGNTIGRHLLTKDTITKYLCSEKVNGELSLWVQNKVRMFKNKDITIENGLKMLLKDRYDIFLDYIRDKIFELLIDTLKNEGVKQGIAKYLKEQVNIIINKNPKEFLISSLYDSIKNSFLNIIIGYKESGNFKDKIEKILKNKVCKLKGLNKSLYEIIPEEIIEILKDNVYKNRHTITNAIKYLLKQEKSRMKLKQIVDEVIGKNLNPLAAMFIKKDKVYAKVLVSFNEFLDNEENMKFIVYMINDYFDRVIKSPISTVVSRLFGEETDACIKPIAHFLNKRIINQGFITDAIKKVEYMLGSYGTIGEVLNKAGIEYISTIDKFIDAMIKLILESQSIKIKLQKVFTSAMDKLLALNVGSIFHGTEDKIELFISKITIDFYNRFIENEAAGMIEAFDVAKIVEDKINEFDVDYVEKIMLDISGKELRAITWLGALLGAIIGLLSPIIS